MDWTKWVQRRAACVEAINRFTQGAGLVGTVVCCRLQEYIDLPTRLILNAAVRLLPLSDDQVQNYLKTAGERLIGLQSLLQRDSAMRIEARSPLMLSLMSHAYQDLPVDHLLREGAVTAAARRKQLMDAYVAHMFRPRPRGRGDEAPRTGRSLLQRSPGHGLAGLAGTACRSTARPSF